jgi:hypothetical protein
MAAEPLKKGWVLHVGTQLWHYYQEERHQEAHRPLCDGPVLMTAALHRHAVAALPAGLPTRYHNAGRNKKVTAGACTTCVNRFNKLKK